MKKKKKKKKQIWMPASKTSKRTQRITFLLNDQEWQLITGYLNKHKIKNRSHWMRETVISSILQKMEANYPTLFSENEMCR